MPTLARLALLAVLTAPAVASAEDGAVRDVAYRTPGWDVSAALLVGAENFAYHEDVPGATGEVVADKHNATLATALLAVVVTAPHGHFYARIHALGTDGSMTYVGATQDGTPLTGPTQGSMGNVELDVGARGGIGDHVWLGGYVGYGARSWDRDLTPLGQPAGYREQYSWRYYPIGVALETEPMPRLTVALDAAVFIPAGDGTLHLSESTLFDDTDVDLRTDFGARVRVTGSYALTRAISVTAMGVFEDTSNDEGQGTALTEMGKPLTDANGNQIYAAEPYTYTKRFSLYAGAAYRF